MNGIDDPTVGVFIVILALIGILGFLLAELGKNEDH